MWDVYCGKCGADLEADADGAIMDGEDFDGNTFEIECVCGATVEITVNVTTEFTVTYTHVPDEEEGE